MFVHTYIFGRPFVTVRPMLSDRCPVCPVLSCLFVCNVGVLWPNGWTDEDATWYGGRLLPRRHCSPQNGTQPPPIFGQCLLWPNGRSSQLLLSSCKNNVRTLELCCVPSSSSVALVFVGCYVILLLSAAGSPPAIYSYYQQRGPRVRLLSHRDSRLRTSSRQLLRPLNSPDLNPTDYEI